MNKSIFAFLVLFFVNQHVSAQLDTMCNGIHFQVMPHPDNCRQYVTCLAGNTVVFNCEEDEFFYPDLNRCIVGNNVECEVYIPTCENEFFSFHANPFYCGRYWACLNYQPIEFECPSYQIFNRRTNRCEYGNQVTCTLN